MIIRIHDFSSPEAAVFANLTGRELRSAGCGREGLFIAESPKVIARALDAGFEPLSFLMEERHISGDAAPLLARCPGLPVYTADRQLLEKLTGYTLTRGVLCAFRRKPPADFLSITAGARRIAVLESVSDATNVGTIFRSAAALGLDALLLTPESADPLCRRCVRVSMGNVFFLPWARIGDSPADWAARGMEKLKAAGFKTLSLALRGDSVDIRSPLLKAEPRLALLLGAEGQGLLPGTIAASDYVATIPMKRGVDSLNVAACAAIAFWELQA